MSSPRICSTNSCLSCDHITRSKLYCLFEYMRTCLARHCGVIPVGVPVAVHGSIESKVSVYVPVVHDPHEYFVEGLAVL